MALARFAKLPAARRERVLAAAAVEFAAHGFKGAALGAIADASGMGKASFYYYFADKADLCRTVLEEAWQRLAAASRLELATLDAATFWSTYERAMLANLDTCAREPWLLAASRMINRPAPAGPGEEVLDELRERRRGWEAAFVRRGQELGTIRGDVPADLLATMSFAARQSSNLWLLERIETVSREETRALARHVLSVYRALLSCPAGSGAGRAP